MLRSLSRRQLAGVILVLLVGGAILGKILLGSGSRPAGLATLFSPQCHCRFAYPAAWYFTPANDDPSRPILGLMSYNDNSADHAPVPSTYAQIGIDWQDDPTGQLFEATRTRNYSPWVRQFSTVSGWTAFSSGHWSAPAAQNGVYEQHVYFFVPWYQRDYDISLIAANPPGQDVTSAQQTFKQFVNSFTILRPDATS